MKTLLFLIIIHSCFIQTTFANANIVGKWKQFDEETGKLRTIIEIKKENDKYVGQITKIFFRPGEFTEPVCATCENEHKGEKIVGMKFMWGFSQDGSNKYSDGKIMNPTNGDLYRGKITMSDDEKSLLVRGFIGFSLFGRTQKWERDTDTSAE